MPTRNRTPSPSSSAPFRATVPTSVTIPVNIRGFSRISSQRSRAEAHFRRSEKPSANIGAGHHTGARAPFARHGARIGKVDEASTSPASRKLRADRQRRPRPSATKYRAMASFASREIQSKPAAASQNSRHRRTSKAATSENGLHRFRHQIPAVLLAERIDHSHSRNAAGRGGFERTAAVPDVDQERSAAANCVPSPGRRQVSSGIVRPGPCRCRPGSHRSGPAARAPGRVRLTPVIATCPAPSRPSIPSAETASFRVTYGRLLPSTQPVRGEPGALRLPGPLSPPQSGGLERGDPPPATRSSGSTTETTTRATPAAINASAQGGVLPWCEQGSSVT